MVLFVLLAVSDASRIANVIDKGIEMIHETGIEMTDDFIAFMLLNVFYFIFGMIFTMFINASTTCKFRLVGSFVINSILVFANPEVALFGLNVFVWMLYLGELT